ncbi:MAG: type II toxin-antitoxin system PemK/MazF family toxin [Syntrophaceae bacterium]|nr:type II toxin-antitoxin system PemK/MazF family toxin [Syntrophaceae bacterium]
MTPSLKHGTIWVANLNPQKGTEPGKTRPVLILQDQALLDAGHPSTIIIPLTTNLIEDAEPLRIRVKAREKLTRDSDLLIDQIRAIDNRRITSGPIADLEFDLMKKVYDAVSEVIGINPFAAAADETAEKG